MDDPLSPAGPADRGSVRTPSSDSGKSVRGRSPAADGGDDESLESFLHSTGFLRGDFSDVTVVAFDHNYHLHRLVLARSPFFASMFSDRWAPDGAGPLAVDFAADANITRTSLEIALADMYGQRDPAAVAQHALAVVATASFLGLASLGRAAQAAAVAAVSADTVADMVQFAAACDYGAASSALLEAARALLLADGWQLTATAWAEFPVEFAAEIVAADGFYVPDEWARCLFVVELVDMYLGVEADVAPLRDVLARDIHYMHLSFERIQQLDEMRTADGAPVVDPAVLQRAVWDALVLRHRTLTSTAGDPHLGLLTPDPPGGRYPVPNVDETMVAVPPAPARRSYAKYPPFRFSHEFTDVDRLNGSDRLYSRTIWYAGSYWNVYVQRVRPRKNMPQLGLYLHRAKPPRAPDVRPPDDDDPDSDPDKTMLVTARAVSGGDSRRPEPSVGEWVDPRLATATYFYITMPSARKQSGGTRDCSFASSPDMFSVSQSWGWKSTLICDAFEDGPPGAGKTLKLSIVLGNV
ncbi:uncharacterized protein V1510DRAFT_421889 [Dipodascopsis tothii]|uniref:uncharacterized protein n=1 Tax=Dipodascopsis tothii TaxID=44089 RepID=UPI0034CD61BA